jgi:hypothetical protein
VGKTALSLITQGSGFKEHATGVASMRAFSETLSQEYWGDNAATDGRVDRFTFHFG